MLYYDTISLVAVIVYCLVLLSLSRHLITNLQQTLQDELEEQQVFALVLAGLVAFGQPVARPASCLY
jgi:H+/gluconate symporter-like permease